MEGVQTIIRKCTKKWSSKKKCNYLSLQLDDLGFATCWDADSFEKIEDCARTQEAVVVDISESEAMDRDGNPFKYLNSLARVEAHAGQESGADSDPSFK